VVRAIHASRIPVVSAVGHEIDITLSDLVADVRALTPSEAAERVVPDREEVLAYLEGQQRRLRSGLAGRLSAAESRLAALATCRVFRRPMEQVQRMAQRLDELAARAQRAVGRRLEVAQSLLGTRAGRLESLSPLGVLARGYSLTTKLEDGRLLRTVRDVAVGDRLRTRLAAGEIISQVESVDVQRDPSISQRDLHDD
jgi:exodeoxyribonuclease VII large subunit